jgi:hypothetical protein
MDAPLTAGIVIRKCINLKQHDHFITDYSKTLMYLLFEVASNVEIYQIEINVAILHPSRIGKSSQPLTLISCNYCICRLRVK